MKRLIVLAIILLFAWCVSLLWAGQAGAGERSPAPPPARAIPIIRPMPIPPDPFKDISNCPWKLRQAFSLEEAEEMLNDGWEYFSTKIWIIMKKRVCE